MGGTQTRRRSTTAEQLGFAIRIHTAFSTSATPLAEPIQQHLRTVVDLTADILAAKEMHMRAPRLGTLVKARNSTLIHLSDSDLEEFAKEAFLLLAANRIRKTGRSDAAFGSLKDIAAQLSISWDDRKTMDALEGALDAQLTEGVLKKDKRDHYILQI